MGYMKNTVKGGTAKRDRFNPKDAAGNVYGSGYYDQNALSCQTVAADVFRSISGELSHIPAFSTNLKQSVGALGGVHYKQHKGWFALPGALESVFNRADVGRDQKVNKQNMKDELVRMMQSIPEHSVALNL